MVRTPNQVWLGEDGFFSSGGQMARVTVFHLDINGDNGGSDIVQTASDQRANGFVWTDAGGAFWKACCGQAKWL